MANRNFHRYQALEQEVKALYGSAAIGGTGAVGTVKGGGISGVVRNSAGNYTITLSDKYNRMLSSKVGFLSPTSSGIANVEQQGTVATFQSSFNTSPTITFQCYDYAGAAADPASGSLMNFMFEVRNSSVGPFDN